MLSPSAMFYKLNLKNQNVPTGDEFCQLEGDVKQKLI